MAVYTHLSHDDIAQFLAQYDIGALDNFKGITEGVSNTNYLISVIPSVAEGSFASGKRSFDSPATSAGFAQDKERYILTLFERRFKLEDLPYFTALMGWWHSKGISCPLPIRMRDGRVLAALKERPALVVSFLEGSGVHKIHNEHVFAVGQLAAQMHIAGMGFPHSRKNSLSLSGWEHIIDNIALRADEIAPGLKKLISEEYNYLSEHWPSELPSGQVHADLFPDNVFFDRNRKLTGVIDFYFACHDAWAYDLAICVNAWCFDDRHRLVPERVAALMQGYNDMRPLTQEEEACFPLLLRGAALRFLLTRAQDALFPAEGAEITPKDPLEYLAKLEFFQRHKL